MEIIKVKLTELKPYGKNPRKNDEAAKAVAKSIEQCGYVAPIIVDENMEILRNVIYSGVWRSFEIIQMKRRSEAGEGSGCSDRKAKKLPEDTAK